MTQPIAIVGGGVIGLSIGWHLTKLGAKVCLFEKERVGSGASSAAAGMITPVSEVRFGEEKLLELFLESLHSYPSFISEIEKTSGIATDFQTSGSLMIAIDKDDEAELTRLYDYQKELGLNATLLTPEQIIHREPLLSHQCVAGIQAPDELFLDNKLLIASLKKAFIKNGGQLFENKLVESVKIEKGEVRAIMAGGSFLPVSQLIVASGLGSKIKGLPDHLALPIRPVKGQALELKNNQPRSLSRAVRTVHRYPIYLVPRCDGRIVVGATSEEMGTDTNVTGGAILDLLYGAWKVLPSSYDMTLTNTWAGLRPTSVDHSPIIGPTDVEGLFVAMGMYRHGILLTPIIGKLIAELVVKEQQSKYFEKFGWERFKQTPKESTALSA